MKREKLIYSIFLILIYSTTSYSQGNVTVQLQQPPPFQFHVEDLWKVTLTSTSQTPVRVYLYGSAVSKTEGPIVDATTAIFSMPQGVKMVQANEIGPIDVNKRNQKYSDIVKKLGGLPTGMYEICVYVKDATTNQVLAFDCIEQEVQNFTEVELLSPANNIVISNEYFEIVGKSTNVIDVDLEIDSRYNKNKVVQKNTVQPVLGSKGKDENIVPVLNILDSPFGTFDKYTINKIKKAEEISVGGEFIVFNWIPPSPVPKNYGIKYKLKVVEELGRQSAYDAMQTNPNFYVNGNITTSTFQYPLSASPFSSGKTYAWQIIAYVNNIQVSKSEIWEFTYLNFKSGHVARMLGLGHIDEYSYDKEDEYAFTGSRGYFEGFSAKDVLKSLREERLSGAGVTLTSISKSKPLEFNMYSKAYGEYNNTRTIGNEQPRNLGNFELVPTMKIYGIPFSMPLFFSSQGNPDKQRINTFGLLFDMDKWKKKVQTMIDDEKEKIGKRIEDEKNKLEQRIVQEKEKIQNRINEEIERAKNLPAEERAKLEQKLTQEKYDLEKKLSDEKGILESKLVTDKDKQVDEIKDGKKLMTGALKWVSYIKSLGVGTTYPEYTKYTVTGISSTGFDIELNPGLFYIATTGYRTQKAITNEAFQRSLFAARLGIGEKDLSHFFLTYMYAKDDPSSMTVDPVVNQTLTPSSDHLIGAEGRLSLLENRLRFEAEGNVSLFTRDVTAASIGAGDIPQFVVDMFNPKISSNIDFMYTFRTEFNNEKSNTRAMVNMIMIGPGYYSLGAPTLRNDKLGFEARIDQKFLDRQISFTANFKRSKDNLITSKASTTTLTSAGINLGLNFRKYPYLRIMYMPFFQSNDKIITTTDSNKIDNKTHILNIIAGYSKAFGSIFSQTNVLFSLQNTQTLFGLYDVNTNNFTLSQSFNFRIPLTLSASFGLVNATYAGGIDNHLINYDVSAGYTFFNVWQNSAGLSVNSEKDKNDKLGFFINSSVFLWQGLNLDFRYDYNSYKEYLIINPNNYNLSSGRLTATFNF